MKLSSFTLNGEKYLIKKIPEKEMLSIMKLPLSYQYERLLRLVTNKKLVINDFSGNMHNLVLLLNKIKEKGVL